MLHGRAREQAAVAALLAGARDGAGGVLVLRGEPGIGKSALLEDAAERAGGLRVLRTAGVEPELELGYATMHRLLLPLLRGVDHLPTAQAGALNVVLGRTHSAVPDRFLVALATLTLLSDAARDTPLLCLVDDAHWADRPSLDALAFAARRLAAEPVALLIATRTDAGPLAGLPELPLAGLDSAAAKELVAERGGVPADEDLLLRTAAGNPLALRELPVGLPTGEPLPLVDRLREAFLDRLRDHPSRQLLLIVAADGTGRRSVLCRAAGVPESALDDLGDTLVLDGATVDFRHPLVRSAVYHSASAAQRRAAHLALAAALEPAERDRRAWHLGQAASGPDPEVAAELEQAGERTLRRAGPATAATTFAKAAALTPPGAGRARRLTAAASAAWQGGAAERAKAWLDEAELDAPRPAMLRALIELRAGDPADALRLLRPIVPEAVAAGPATAIELLMLFGEASYHAADADAWCQVTAAVEQLPLDEPAAPGEVDEDRALLRLARAVSRVRAGTPAGLGEHDLATVERLADPGRLCWAGGMVWGIGDQAHGRWLRRRAMERAVALGAVGTLAWVLQFVVIDELAAGRLLAAAAHADEGHRHAVETGQPNLGSWFLGTLATVAALRGRDAEAREFADQALTGTVGRNLVAAVALANRALGLLDLAAGRAEQAVAHLRPLVGPAHPGLVLQNVPDFVEAAHRLDRPDLVAEPLARYTRWAEATGSPDLLALAARCAALGGAGEAAFRRALELHPADQPVELARTQLLYGEYLRRDRRRADARTQLRAALTAFTHLDATGWADRARDELRATGETATEPTPDAVSVALSALTPQELRIATAVAEGSTNREIAAQLFLSTRTVDYHLRKVFQKTGITSRTELVRLAVPNQHQR